MWALIALLEPEHSHRSSEYRGFFYMGGLRRVGESCREPGRSRHPSTPIDAGPRQPAASRDGRIVRGTRFIYKPPS